MLSQSTRKLQVVFRIVPLVYLLLCLCSTGISMSNLLVYVLFHGSVINGEIYTHNTRSLLFPQATLELSPNAQIWPRNLNTEIRGTAGKIYLIVADIGGAGLDFRASSSAKSFSSDSTPSTTCKPPGQRQQRPLPLPSPTKIPDVIYERLIYSSLRIITWTLL